MNFNLQNASVTDKTMPQINNTITIITPSGKTSYKAI